MQSFDTAALLRAHAAAGRAYHEFLRVPALSMGVYCLPAGGVDSQGPHAEALAPLVFFAPAESTAE